MIKTTIIILFAGIAAMMTSGIATNTAQGQLFLTNEMPNPTNVDPSFMSFEQFMQYMFYYEQLFGKDYVTKIYKEYHEHDNDDDDKNDKKKHKKKDKDWWKHNSVDLWKDKKKYCEGKGEFKNGKCVTDNDEDKADWEDAVCDNNPKKSKFCDRNDDDDDKDEKDEGISNEEIKNTFQALEDEEENQKEDYDEQLEEEEQKEEESEEQDEEEDDSGDDDSDDDDSDDDSGDDDDSGGDSEEGDE